MSRASRVSLAMLALFVLTASLGLDAWTALRKGAAPRIMDLQSFADAMMVGIDTPTPASSRDEVPDLELEVLQPYRSVWGETLRLHDYVGRTPLVVNFWASWCPPCRREAPLLQAAWQEYRGRVQFIGINHRDQEGPAREFIREYGQSFPSGADPKGDAATEFGLVGVPTTYFVDRTGLIQATKVGEITEEELDSYLQALLSPETP